MRFLKLAIYCLVMGSLYPPIIIAFVLSLLGIFLESATGWVEWLLRVTSDIFEAPIHKTRYGRFLDRVETRLSNWVLDDAP